MTSQLDLDQSGTSRQWQRTYLGPSIGWQLVPYQSILPVTAAGTYNLDPSTNLVEVNVAAAVTIVLPSCQFPAAGAQAQPRLFAANPVTIVDIGGNAASNNITIQPNNVSETVMGLTSIKIATNFGGFTLQPVSSLKTWTSISP
jgi:hypothetical protein